MISREKFVYIDNYTFMNKDDNLAGAARYYASPQEQKILVQGLIRYFSLPERSQNRNKVVKEVASYLSMISPHWSHRAVRLWFNNNRHTYLPALKDQQPQANLTAYPNMIQNQQNPNNQITSFSTIPTNNNINMNNNANLSMNMNIPNAPFQPQNVMPSNISPEHQISPNPQVYPMFPMNTTENVAPSSFYNSPPITPNIPSNQQPANPFKNQLFTNNNKFIQQYNYPTQTTIKPPIQVNPPISFNQQQANSKQYPTSPSVKTQISTNSSLTPIFPVQQNSPAMQTSLNKGQLNNPALNFSMNKASAENTNENGNNYYFQMNGIQQQQQMCEAAYIPISAMLNEIRKLYSNGNLNDPRLSNLIPEFEKQCMQVSTQHGSIPPEQIEPMIDYVTFKFPANSEEANLGGETGFPYSNSTNDFSEINDRPESFGHANVWDHITPNNIWNQRPFVDETLTYFESCLLTDNCFAFTSLQFGSAQRTLSVKKYRQRNQSSTIILNSNANVFQNSPVLASNSSSVYQLNTESVIDSMCINNDDAFLLSKKTVIRLSLSESSPKTTINLDSIMDDSNLSVSAGLIKSFAKSSAIVSFSNVPSLYFTNQNGSASTVKTSFSGFIDVSSFGISKEKILICTSNSPTIRLISSEGIEMAAFFGHLGQVMGVEPLTENIFASRGEDKTVRIWDYRMPRMITTITTPKVSTLCITGSRNFVICGFSNKNVGVTDIRKEQAKPLLGVSTQDYNAIMLKYDDYDDSLMMFGQVEKDTTRDSMIFVDTDGHSRQSILRHYSHFIGVDSK